MIKVKCKLVLDQVSDVIKHNIWSFYKNEFKNNNNLESLEKYVLLTMLTILDIIELEPVEHASILKGPSWNRLKWLTNWKTTPVPRIKGKVLQKFNFIRIYYCMQEYVD